MSVECRKCGAGPWQGATLHRQNPLGEKGIWECEDCGAKADPSVAESGYQSDPCPDCYVGWFDRDDECEDKDDN